MRFGLLLLGEHAPDKLLRLARYAEDGDFEHIWFADEKFFRDPYASLTFLSQHTRRIKLGTCVTDPYTRHPAITAMAMATTDEYAEGRCVLGIGAGFSGLQAMGLHRERPVTSLREAIELIRKLWAGGVVTFEGQTVYFRDGKLDFAARPDIPIAIASAGRQILRLAGEVADQVVLGDLASVDVIAKALAEVEAGARVAGRSVSDTHLVTRVNLIITDDLRAGTDLVRPWITGDLWGIFPNWKSMFTYKPEWDERLRPLRQFIEDYGGRPRNVGDFALIEEYNDVITDEMVHEKALVGPVDGIVKQIVEIARTGIREIAMYPLPLPHQDIETVVDLFTKEVKPRVDKALA
jgi:5,10-methylenetetrahydromethanopterin reductase